MFHNFLCFCHLHFYTLFQHAGGPDCFGDILDNCLHDPCSLDFSYHGKEDLLFGVLRLHSARPFVGLGQLSGHVFICAGAGRRFASC